MPAEWTTHVSKNPGTRVAVTNAALTIQAAANVSAFAERALPAGATAVECQLDAETDQGQTWGPGLALFWPQGQALRVNVRPPEGCFGVDTTAAPQNRTGHAASTAQMTLRIRLEPDKVIAEARNDGEDWQVLATFPRDKFPGDPAKLRLGKLHGIEGMDDHTDPGPDGTASFRAVRVLGKASSQWFLVKPGAGQGGLDALLRDGEGADWQWPDRSEHPEAGAPQFEPPNSGFPAPGFQPCRNCRSASNQCAWPWPCSCPRDIQIS